jgi:hypothetical protein
MHFHYPYFHISMVVLQYHEEYQYRIHNQILKPVTCIETFSVLSGSVMKMVSLA